MADGPSLAPQIKAAQQGDGEAFARLIEPFEARLYQLALGVTGNHQDAEDVWQNTLLRAWKSIRRVKRPEAFRTWISKIVVNECRRIMRQPKGKTWRLAVSMQDSSEDLADTCGHSSQETVEGPGDIQNIVDQITVLSYLQELPRKQRETLLLRFWLDMPLQEVARATGVPLSTAKSRLYRGLKALEPLLKREGFGHGRK